jgi:N-acetylmuramoyl-L-alanine amidase
LKKIAIDAGHGGKDPGALGNGLQEKDLTLRLALRIGELLAARSADVLYTRKDDRYLALSERATVANQAGADFFLSVHVNSGGGTGFESYTHIRATTAETAYQNVIHQRVAAVFSAACLPDRGQKRADFAVLRETKMPALLLEYGFIDHATDAAKLQDPVCALGWFVMNGWMELKKFLDP